VNFPSLGDKESINIRPATEEDLPQFLVWMNDSEIQKTFISKIRTFTLEGQGKQIGKMHSEEFPKQIVYAILLQNQLIGRLKLDKINWEKKSAHTSILISPDEELRGKGYGTEAFKLLVELAKNLNLNLLISKVKEENLPSIKIHEKLGFNKNETKGNYELPLS
jgi:RimJ/RimL family protein N-acetyltransferase